MSCPRPEPAGEAGPRANGVRLPSLDVLARHAAFGPVTATRYGRTATIHAAAITAGSPSRMPTAGQPA